MGIVGFASPNPNPNPNTLDSSEGRGSGSSDFLAKLDPEIFHDSHILGSHLVHVLPPTLAKLNPDGASFCLGHSEKTAIIPLKIKGTPPWTVLYRIYTFDGKDPIEKYVTLSPAASVPSTTGQSEKKERVTATVSIPAEKLGIYHLIQVNGSTSGDVGKILRSTVEVVQCPSATLISREGKQELLHVDRCLDESFDFNISMYGTPPFSAWYLRQIGKTKSLLKVNGRMDPLTDVAGKKLSNQVPESMRQLVLAAQPRKLAVPVALNIDTATDYVFKLVQVLDGRNNTVLYLSDADHEAPPATDHILSASESSNTIIVHGRELPSARFERCEGIKLRFGLDKEKYIPVTLQGNGPWDLRYARAASEEDVEAGNFEEVLTVKQIEHPKVSIEVKKPGIYVLLSVSDKYCSGSVELPTTCLIQQAVAPTIDISVAPIVRECFGETGVDVNISMTGSPPFWVEYDQYNKVNGWRETAIKEFESTTHTMRLQPPEPGEYEYTFKRIGDKMYEQGVQIRSKNFTQVVHSLPDVKVISAQKTRCLGDRSIMDLSISGVPPYTLAYDIQKGSKKEGHVISVTDKSISIETPSLEQAGTYLFVLNSLTDGNGCTAVLASRPVLIEVLAARPSAHFRCPKPIFMLEDASTKLPVVVSGQGNYKLEYRTAEVSDHVKMITGDKGIDSIQVKMAGIYQLVSIEDAYCTGRVVEPSKCKVITIPKPTLEIPESEYTWLKKEIRVRDSVCQNTPDHMYLHLTGKAPFQIKYSHKRQDGHASLDHTIGEYQDRGDPQVARIDMVTDRPGTHTYTFISIADDNYRTPVKTGPLTLEQYVNARPTAKFLDEKDRIFQCISKESDTALRMEMTGEAPFSIQVHRKHESQPREVIHLTANESSFTYHPETTTTTGKYTYTIKSISDASGCETHYGGTEPGSRVTVQVADMARITMNRVGVDLCVGDLVSYSLQGTPPFTIGYTFNEIPKPDVMVRDPTFMLYPATNGTINVTHVCNSDNCCYYPPRGLVQVIHPLPKAFMDGGFDMVDDIQEGQESFVSMKFEGTPPFSFRYSRTPLVTPGSKAQEPPETFTQDNVNDRAHSFYTDKEGLFKITWIKDKFCEYPPSKTGKREAANAVVK
ncbi:hypothetical protein PhCBS80983_g05715 [Powellomyces hirtus]|uniref:Uncharacterized protein n=1 Tax=Powellomyces hirtus TaxID=109895 RepID=A0A507DUB7_9FUNG|nr:hypothetical protein PhCBS80983_g05715 [Powellomyces hirtus]